MFEICSVTMDTQSIILKSLEPLEKIRRRHVASHVAHPIDSAHTFNPSNSSLTPIDPNSLSLSEELACVNYPELFVYSHEAKAMVKFQDVSVYTPRIVRFEERFEAVLPKPMTSPLQAASLAYPSDSDTIIILHQWDNLLVDIPSHIKQLYMIRSVPQFSAQAITGLTHMALLDLTELMAFPTKTLNLFVACYSGSVKLPQGCRVHIHTAFRDVMERDEIAADHWLFNYGEDMIPDEHLISSKYEICGEQVVMKAFGRQFRVVRRVMRAVGGQ